MGVVQNRLLLVNIASLLLMSINKLVEKLFKQTGSSIISGMSEYVALFEEYERNWSWFRENYGELVKKFDGEFVAIYKQKIVDHDKELSNLMERIREKYPGENVFVDFVSREKLMLILEAAKEPVF
ncbi:MAG: DUF5678 domain-containing protein [Thermoproteota archaeon]